MNIDLSEYKLVVADSIEKKYELCEMYDIEVEDDNTFFISLYNCSVLSHNCDGYHIQSLLINFFNNWFPNIIMNNKLYNLNTPIISTGEGKKRKYYYNIEDFKNSNDKKNIRYLKGLGSLDYLDWNLIFSNLDLELIRYDNKSKKMLDIAFGKDTKRRKFWLQSKK